MQISTFFPNVVPKRSFSTGAAAWKMISSDGNVYDTYVALLAAGKTPWPGSNDDFPTGIPVMNIRTTGAAGNVDGGVVLFKTNTTMTPTDIHDADDMVSGSGQQVSMPGGIKNIWIWQVVTGDYTILGGRY